MDIVEVLKNTSRDLKLDIEESTLADTIEEVGEHELGLLLQLSSRATSLEQIIFLDGMLRQFFQQAMKRQQLRNNWKWAMDPNDPLDMFVDRNGDIVFREVSK